VDRAVEASAEEERAAAERPPEPASFDPDADLVARARAGDRVAFETLLRRHYDRIHRVAWRLTGSRADAQDIAQEVCCVLVDKLASFRGEAKFATWLMGIVVNACRDHGRRSAAFARLKEGFAVLARLARPVDGRDLYRRTWLASSLARLSPMIRHTVALVAFEGLTHGEAAQALGVSESTVSWRMYEARRLLRAAENDEPSEPGKAAPTASDGVGD
jgi:RNA polymerase sigma factor (sigma-70 family)